jgi:predicted PurR-regulated permease PerM
MAVIDKLKLFAGQKAPDHPSAAAPTAAAAADEDDLPIPSDIKAVFLGGLFLLGMLAACYVAAEIVLPIILAFVLSLVLTPAMRKAVPVAVQGSGLPILGPMIGVVVFLLAGLLSIDTLWLAFLPAGLYLLIHLVEGETVTPMLLARRFTINPVLVVLSLVFWYWMWGVPGAVLSTPMLAIAKIICDRIRPLMAFGHFMEG